MVEQREYKPAPLNEAHVETTPEMEQLAAYVVSFGHTLSDKSLSMQSRVDSARALGGVVTANVRLIQVPLLNVGELT